VSDTPRTDAEASPYSQGPDGRRCIRIDFARQLERELNAAKGEIGRKDAVIKDFWERRDEVHQLRAEIERLREAAGKALAYMESIGRLATLYPDEREIVEQLQSALAKEPK
jgi:hypothetical protein